MSDFIGDRECTTHHACDCIRAKLEHAEELVRWADTYGHPEEWAQKAKAAHERAERAEAALRRAELQIAPDSSNDLELGENNRP